MNTTSTGASIVATAVARRAWWLLLLVACNGNPTGPESTASGVYLLERADGSELPTSLPPQDGCPRSATYGQLGLTPEVGSRRPIYVWSVNATVSCAGSPAVEQVIERDFGFWSALSSLISFSSEFGRHGYSATLSDDGGERRLVLESVTGASYEFVHVREFDAPTGFLTIKAVDGTGSLVTGAVLDIRAPDGIREGAVIAGQPYTTRGPGGTWAVTVTPPEGFVIAPGQPNPATAEVTVNNTTVLQILLAPTAP